MDNKLKILFNEDVRTDAELIWRELKKSNLVFEKLLVDNKQDFVNGLKSLNPDIIISDYSLPQFTGMQALVLRNELAPATPFIIVTGSINENVAVECMKAGADDYILKDNLSRLGLSVINALAKAKLIRERNFAEAALRESEERYRIIVEKSPNTIAIHQDGKLVFLNPAGAKLIGSNNPEELIGTPILNYLHPDCRSDVLERMRLISKGNAAPLFEEKFIRLDGSELNVEVVGIPINFHGREAIQVIIQDITERKKAEEAVRHSELRFKQISENFGEWIWEVDKNGLYIYSSPVVKKLLGYEPEELINRKYFYDLFSPDDKEKNKNAAFGAFSRKENFRNFINVNIHKDGSEVVLSTSGFPLFDKDGNLIGYRGVDTDITEVKKAEETLKESEKKYRNIFENVQDVYYETSINGTILNLSPSISIMSKGHYHSSDLIGRSMYDFYSDAIERELIISELKEKGNVSDFEIKLKNLDGSNVPCSISAKIIFNINGSPEKIIGSMRDITARKKAEEDLERSKKEFQNYFESGSVGMSVTLPDKSWIEVNQKLCQMFGYSREELLSMTWLDLSHPEDRAINIELFQKSIEGKIDNYELEKRFIRKDNKIIHVTLSVVCERNYDGSVHHFLASYIDVTERALAEEKIQYERLLLRTLIDNLPDPIYVLDKDGRKVIANKADVANIGAISEAEVLGKTDIDLFPGPSGERGHADNLEVIRTGKAIIEREEDFVDKNLQRNWLLTTKVPLHSTDKSIYGLVGIGHNITNRRKAEYDLKQSALFNDTLLKTIPFGMDIVDETGTVLFQSDNFKRLFGEEAIGDKCWNLYRDDKIQCGDCPLRKGINVGETEAYESHGVMGGRVFEIIHTGMMYQGNRAMLEIFQEITERKANEEELIAAKEKAEESDRLKTAFLHNISHEIRTPMNAIVGFSALLSEPGLDHISQQSYTDTILKSSDHLLAIISDIVDISNIEANLVKISRNLTEISSTLKSVCKQFLPIANEKNIQLEHISELSISDNIFYTDTTKLTQILSNLINNALKFTDNGRILVKCIKHGSQLEFSVSDTGIGIAPLDQAKVFERFFQVQKSVSRVYEGTGLGLSISKAYVELLGGKIWLSSTLGEGTTFFFTLPTGNHQEIQEVKIIEKPEPKISFEKIKKILIAEDIDSNYKLLTYFLSDTNAKLLRAKNGREAVDKVSTDKSIDMILMDIKMPEMDGYTAVKLIREANIQIPIIAQTAYYDERDKAISAGCNGFISKPFDKKALIKIISEFI